MAFLEQKYEMEEFANIIRFLTKFGVCADMQNEIMRYYQLPKQKYWLLYIEDGRDRYDTNGNGKKYAYGYRYKELLPYTSIDQINLIGLFKFIYDENIKLDRTPDRMIKYDETGFVATNILDDYNYQYYTPREELIEDLKNWDGCVEIYDSPFSSLFDYARGARLCLKEFDI